MQLDWRAPPDDLRASVILAADLIRYFRKHGDAASRWLAPPVLLGAFFVEACIIVSRRGRWQ